MNPTFRSKPYRNQPLAGALLVLSASFTFAAMGALIKVVSTSLANELVVFFRNFCALVFILPWILYSRSLGGVKTSVFQFHLLRSLSGIGAMYCFFYSIAHLQLSEACLLASTTPLFIPVIAYVWIREPVARKVKGAIIIGFIGVLLILKPGTGVFQPIAMVALAAGMFAALAMVSIRRMSASEPAIRIVFYFSALGTLISAVPLVWSWQLPQPKIWCLLVLIGMMAAVGQILITKGYSLAPAAQVGPFTYGNVVFATFLGWLFWGESLDAMKWAGAVLICIAGIIAIRRTKTHALLDTTAGETTPICK